MVYGIILGAGAGMTVTTLLYIWMLGRANRRSRENSEVVEELLIRKAEASEELVTVLKEYIEILRR